MPKVPEVTQQLADELTRIAITQLRTSRDYKRARMQVIKGHEDLYMGIVPKTLRNPFNDSYPFMSGFVDTLHSKIDDPPKLVYGHNDEADYKKAIKITAAFEREVKSPMPNAKWALKDRWAKRLATFSGRGIHKYYAESDPHYKSNFEVIDHYDFHCEPGGGGHLENHLFCGEENIFRTKEDLVDGAKAEYYDAEQVARIATHTNANEYKENSQEQQEKDNRHRALGLDRETNNYVGQDIFRLFEWYLTYKGIRWQLTFDETSSLWLRVKPLREVFKPHDSLNGESMYPYPTWATHEDPKVFWSKAPCDDASPIAKQINRFLNQESYAREKKLYGQRGYDPERIMDLEALANSRPDALIPVDTKGGTKSIASALYEFQSGEVKGTLDLVQFLNSFSGEKSGISPSTQGTSEKGKQATVFFGELQQVADRLGVYNKSYRECWEELGLRFMDGLDDHLTTPMAIKLMGAEGVEWTELTRTDLKTNRELDISISGGQAEDQENELISRKKLDALKSVATVNPRWKDEEALRAAGYTDEQIKRAFDPGPSASQELLSEAAQAIEDIVKGKKPKLNRGANAQFMQKILDFATDSDLKREVFDTLIEYAEAHARIAAENEARNAAQLLNDARMRATLQMQGKTGGGPAGVSPELAPRLPTGSPEAPLLPGTASPGVKAIATQVAERAPQIA